MSNLQNGLMFNHNNSGLKNFRLVNSTFETKGTQIGELLGFFI